jgi:GT2 family glycosyltransferase
MTDKQKNELFFSIIIPVKYKNDYLLESIENCLELDYLNFEILIFPDKYFEYNNKKVRIVPTGNIGPAEKRDLSLKYARGNILAFLDDDAYPAEYWLKNSVKYFGDSNISAVCGPAITPENDNLIQKLSGEIYSSAIASGNTTFRYKPVSKIFEVDDFPSVNFLIRKEDFKAVGGFDSTFWPGEDTKLCLDIINLGKKIIYDPEVLVYHHRRTSFKKHLIQSYNYAVHRGYFVKKYPRNSAKIGYFVPSIFLIFIVLGFIGTFFNKFAAYSYLAILAFYTLMLVINSLIRIIKNKDLRLSFLLIPGIFLTHIFYGSGFIKGLFTGKLER